MFLTVTKGIPIYLKYRRHIFYQIWKSGNVVLNLASYGDIPSISIENPKVQQYLKHLEEEHEGLKIKDLKSKRYHELSSIISLLEKKKEIDDELRSLNEMVSEKDDEMKTLIAEERESFTQKIEEINNELCEQILPLDEEEFRDIALEVTAGVGGQEAMLFASELLTMYEKYAIYKNWEWNIVEMDSSELGGLRHACIFLSGQSVYNSLKSEGGVHRVQRIPSTEKSGRLHTSTVTVAVLPQPTDIEIVLKDKDIKLETKRSSGAGGQHVNKTDSCVRLTHIPTGIIVESQEDRSQIKNKEIAFKKLRLRLYDIQQDEQLKQTKSSRKEQVGSSLRSEKVRTYNYNQDRVTDHRLGESVHHLDGFLSGGPELDNLIQKLCRDRQVKELMRIIDSELKR